MHNYFAERVPCSPRPFFYGRGRAARRLLCFCKRRDARVRVQTDIGAQACSAPSPGRHAGCGRWQPARRPTSPAKKRAR